MSIPQIPQPGSNNDAPLGQFINHHELPTHPDDIAMADDPPAAGAAAIFQEARPLEGLIGRTGPKTVEGKAIVSRNAVSHGCCAKKRDAVEEIEFQGIHGGVIAEYSPESPEECFTVEQIAEAEFRYNKCQRALTSNAFHSIDRHKAERRKPLEDQLFVLEASLHLWEDAAARKLALGQGFGNTYPILLKDLDPSVSTKNLKSPEARMFAYHHTLATEVSPRDQSLLDKYGQWNADRSDLNEYREYERTEERLRSEYHKLWGWVTKHLKGLQDRYEKLKRDLAVVDSLPVDKDLVELISDEYRKISRYQKEAESAIHRHRKAMDQIRGRLLQSYERQLLNVQKKHPVMFKVGSLGIHLPDSLSGLSPYDQIEAIVKVLLREQRYYDRSQRNNFRRIAEMGQPYRNEGITAATWNEPDSDGKGGTRIIGGETSLRPAPGAPKPPDAPDLPR